MALRHPIVCRNNLCGYGNTQQLRVFIECGDGCFKLCGLASWLPTCDATGHEDSAIRCYMFVGMHAVGKAELAAAFAQAASRRLLRVRMSDVFEAEGSAVAGK